MAVKIRLQRQGRKKAPWYTIVVANSRSPRDGKYIERLGTYDPTTVPATISINNDKALDWMYKGAQPTDTVRRILSYKGVMYKKHLDRGVKMNVLTQEKAEQLYKDFIVLREDQVRRQTEEKLNKEKKVKDTMRANEVKKREAMEAARKPKIEEAAAAAEGQPDVAVVDVNSEAPAAATAAPEAPVAEAPPAEAPAAETPVAEAAPAEAPATEAPKEEAAPTETPAAEAPKEEAPTSEAPAAEAPAPEEQSPETPPSEEQPK